MKNQRTILGTFTFVLFAWMLAPAAFAQTDEIQVYDGGLADVGKFNLTIHSNFTPKGIKTPAFPGAITSDHSFNGAAEWALGVTKWFEAGLYLPLYSVDKDLGAKTMIASSFTGRISNSATTRNTGMSGGTRRKSGRSWVGI
ncbi:MAG: hypothetical protein DMG13_26350 [Acidobacteria bacterium]|nr:MAG: hypothetical protein DMG13_26350 [Acidobacteriota bacterium]